RREQQLAAIFRDDVELFLGLRMHPLRLVLVALGKEVRLDDGKVFERRRVLVDDHVIDHLERGKVERAQFLRNEGPVLRLGDMRVPREAHDEDVGLALRIEQMTEVPGMHEIEGAVAHNHRPGARPRPDGDAQLLESLDLSPIGAVEARTHVTLGYRDGRTRSWSHARSNPDPRAARRANCRSRPSFWPPPRRTAPSAANRAAPGS